MLNLESAKSKVRNPLGVKNDKGATAVEYALIIGLIAVALIVAVGFFGTQLSGTFNRIACEVQGKTFQPGTDAVGETPATEDRCIE